MQPQQGYLRKLTRLGFGLIVLAALTLPMTAAAVSDASQATADGELLIRSLAATHERGEQITWSLDRAWPLPSDH